MSSGPVEDAADEDPVIAEYDVYITPEKAEQIFILQYPNRPREEPYNAARGMAPLEMRIKPKAGIVEVDVPLTVSDQFDKLKGLKYGEALRKAHEDGQVTFGIAAGFDRLPIPPPRAAGREADEDDLADQGADSLLERFEEANDRGLVMNKQTLGGQIVRREPGDPMYMLGAFRGKELHLTKLDGIVQMRPQFHHLDAITHMEHTNRRREREAGGDSKNVEARSVHLTIRPADQHDSKELASTKRLLHAAKEDHWVTLRYHDEDSDEAYEAYHETLFLKDVANAPKLQSSMTNEQYLDAISVPRNDPCGRPKKKLLTRKQMRAIDDSDESDAVEE